MHYLGIEAALKNQPLLDPAFIPFGIWRREYEKEAVRPFALAVERDHGAVSVFETARIPPRPITATSSAL